MEIIDRPLSEVIKEQKIGQELRRNSRNSRRPSSNSGNSRNNNNTNNNNNRGGRRGGRRGEGETRRRFRDPFGSRRRLRDDRRSSLRDEPRRGRAGRRNAVVHVDSRRERGVKSFGTSRRPRVTAADRNDRERRRRRDTAPGTERRDELLSCNEFNGVTTASTVVSDPLTP
eukprot:gene7227-5079_t